jgi:hypothetical protein
MQSLYETPVRITIVAPHSSQLEDPDRLTVKADTVVGDQRRPSREERKDNSSEHKDGQAKKQG